MSLNSSVLYRALSQPLDKEIDPFRPSNRSIGSLHVENTGIIDHEVGQKTGGHLEGIGSPENDIQNIESLGKSSTSFETGSPKDSDCLKIKTSTCKSLDENKKIDSPVIPEDFLCPISLELMRDPVIASTGQVTTRITLVLLSSVIFLFFRRKFGL